MSTSAGPFMRYGNSLPGSSEWTASVLFLTKAQGADATSGGVNSAAAPIVNGPQPVLTYEDPEDPQRSASSSVLKQVTAELLETVMGWSFWRFDLSLQLGSGQRPIKYSVSVPGGNDAPSYTFWLPALGQPFHWGYYSCNGLSSDVEEDHYARKDPTYLWRDLLQVHATFPIHVLVGGGDQVYSDAVWQESGKLREWSAYKTMKQKLQAPWTPELEAECTAFYLRNYMDSYTMKDVSTAYASIPTVMIYDDHDIFDGWGSYDPELQASPVFQNLFAVAHRFYLLYQQHTTFKREQEKPEFIFHELGYHSVRYMGPQVALLAIDMRTRRTKGQILPPATYQLIEKAALELPESVKHVVMLSGVPLVFPSIPMSESILNGMKAMFTKIAFCRCLGQAAGIMDRFGQPEILDDLIDGWMAAPHRAERKQFIGLLHKIALTKHVRVTVLSGDAHVGGVGRLYSWPKKHPEDDPLFIAQIISSAIMNAPPPLGVVKMLMRTNFAGNLDPFTRQKMVKAFWPYHPRTDKLLARRNWCDVTMAAPPFSAPANPNEPSFGGLRFTLRAENPSKWHGYAEEVYEIFVPRAPGVGAPKEKWWRRRIHWRSDDQEEDHDREGSHFAHVLEKLHLADSPSDVKEVTPPDVKAVGPDDEITTPPVKNLTEDAE